ncbi:MAG: nicotinate-nucleotide adenylyltransferase [Desulfuromonadaceae bacterium]
MNIGLLGGSFNPVHNAHLRIAGEAQRFCRLDKVIFIPAADPPHKAVAGDVSFACRSEMVSVAIAGKAGIEMSTLEAERSGKSYSIDTIRIFQKQFPDDDLFFIIGADSFLEIGSWHRYDEILNSCHLIVLERPGSPVSDRIAALPKAIREEFTLDRDNGCLRHHAGTTITFITGVSLDVSSTEIRRLAAIDADISTFVPPDVAAYISQQRIYHQCQ